MEKEIIVVGEEGGRLLPAHRVRDRSLVVRFFGVLCVEDAGLLANRHGRGGMMVQGLRVLDQLGVWV